MKERILLVDDDPVVLEVLEAVLVREGFQITRATTGVEGLEILGREPHALALCDIRMPGMDGFELLREIRRRHPELDVVLTTGYGSVEGAVDAMALGAADYLTKPLKPKEVVARLRAVLRRRQLEAELHELQRELHLRSDIRSLVAESPRMRALVTAIQRIGGDAQPVLLRGEAGSGRRFVARAIHFSGERRDGPFESIDCASPPRKGLEALLFTQGEGGPRTRRGLLERLKGGSLHLHRLEHAAPEVQRELGNAIGSAARGDRPEAPAAEQARLILSLDQDLDALLGWGRLPSELDVLRTATVLDLPPLRERGQDLPGLIATFCRQHAVDQGRQLQIAADVVPALAGRELAGNVRELFDLLKRAATLSLDGVVTREALDRAERLTHSVAQGGRPIADDLGDREYQLVMGAVQRNPGRLDEAARELGVSRTTLWRRMRKYGIRV